MCVRNRGENTGCTTLLDVAGNNRKTSNAWNRTATQSLGQISTWTGGHTHGTDGEEHESLLPDNVLMANT